MVNSCHSNINTYKNVNAFARLQSIATWLLKVNAYLCTGYVHLYTMPFPREWSLLEELLHQQRTSSIPVCEQIRNRFWTILVCFQNPDIVGFWMGIVMMSWVVYYTYRHDHEWVCTTPIGMTQTCRQGYKMYSALSKSTGTTPKCYSQKISGVTLHNFLFGVE